MAAKKKPGRPPTHDREAVMAKVCQRIALGELVDAAAKAEGVDRVTVWRWTEEDDAMRNAYARARESQAHAMAEAVIALADNEEIPADSRRVRVDARKWLTSKIAPRVYGDRQQHEHTGGVTVSLNYVESDE